MSDCKTFVGVTQAVFDCVKETSLHEHKTVYDPPNAYKGTATTKIPWIGTVVLSFDLNISTGTIQYCIVSKPEIVPANSIFNGIADTITSCQQK